MSALTRGFSGCMSYGQAFGLKLDFDSLKFETPINVPQKIFFEHSFGFGISECSGVSAREFYI